MLANNKTFSIWPAKMMTKQGFHFLDGAFARLSSVFDMTSTKYKEPQCVSEQQHF